MIFKETGFEGLKVILPKVFEDNRGCFFESYSERDFKNQGIDSKFVQDNISISHKNVLRGMHFQLGKFAQAKLVRVVKGSVYDVVVDLRKNSSTFGKWFGIELNETNKAMLYVPIGFAHGFLSLADNTMFTYKCSAFYNKESESGLLWNDKTIGIDWNIELPIVAEKDLTLPTFDPQNQFFY